MTEHARDVIYLQIEAERLAQDRKWGEQNHPDGTGTDRFKMVADYARLVCERSHAAGTGTWAHILLEEVCEAFAESDPQKLRTELIQAIAVATAWIEAIERRAVA